MTPVVLVRVAGFGHAEAAPKLERYYYTAVAHVYTHTQ